MDETVRARWGRALPEGSTFTELDPGATYKPPLDTTAPIPPKVSAGDEPFTFLAPIGRGGMGVVFRARQSCLAREVAVKQVHEEDGANPEARRQFLAESFLTARLDHPNIVPVHELRRDGGGRLSLAMKLVRGRSWKESLADERDLVTHLRILDRVCDAVAFAHSRGIVHNDLKPANVMLGRFGEVLVMDWGVAAVFEPQPENAGLRRTTSIRHPIGTPRYMAPELAEGAGEKIGPHTDVYLLGAILYKILTGRPPHGGRNFLQVVSDALAGRIRPLPEEHPAGLRALCARALEVEPEQRHPSVLAFQEELRAYLQHRESLQVSEAAEDELAECERRAAAGVPDERARRALYEGFAGAVAGFRQARRLWEENPDARAGESAARRAWAHAALGCGDLGLADVQLAAEPPDAPEVARLRAAIAAARERQRRERRTRRWLSRGLLAALVAIVLGAVGAAWSIERQRQVADTRGRVAESALVTMTASVIEELDAIGTQRARRLRQAMLESALQGWQRLRAADRRVSVSRHTAQTLLSVGELRFAIGGDAAEARASIEAALAVLDQLETSRGARMMRAQAHQRLSRIASSAGTLDEAFASGAASLTILRELREEEDDRHELLLILSEALRWQMLLAENLGREAELNRLIAEKTALLEILGALPGDEEDALTGLAELADLARYRGDDVRADSLLAEACTRLVATTAREPDDMARVELLAMLEKTRAGILWARGARGAALDLAERGLRRARAVQRADPLNDQLGLWLGLLLSEVGVYRWYEGLSQPGLEACAEAVALVRRFEGASHDDAEALAAVLHRQAELLVAAGDDAAALPLLEECVRHLRSLLPRSGPRGRLRVELAAALRHLAGVESRLGKPESARAAVAESIALLESQGTPGELAASLELDAALDPAAAARSRQRALALRRAALAAAPADDGRRIALAEALLAEPTAALEAESLLFALRADAPASLEPQLATLGAALALRQLEADGLARARATVEDCVARLEERAPEAAVAPLQDALRRVAEACAEAGEHARAAALSGAELRLARRGFRQLPEVPARATNLVSAVWSRALLFARAGVADSAMVYAEELVALRREVGLAGPGGDLAWCLSWLARGAQERGARAEAAIRLAEAAAVVRAEALDDPDLLEELAVLAGELARDDPARATELWARANELWKRAATRDGASRHERRNLLANRLERFEHAYGGDDLATARQVEAAFAAELAAFLADFPDEAQLAPLGDELRGAVRRLELASGARAPTAPGDHYQLGQALYERERYPESALAFGRHFAAGEDLTALAFLWGASSAALAVAADPDNAELWEARALAWLDTWLATLRAEQAAARARGDAEMVASLTEEIRAVWRDDPDFAALRGAEAFESLFAGE